MRMSKRRMSRMLNAYVAKRLVGVRSFIQSSSASGALTSKMATDGTDKQGRIDRVEKSIPSFPDFPKPGILFWDIFPLMKIPDVFADLVSLMVEHVEENHGKVDLVVGLDARGFIFGPLMAQRLGVGFVPVRKAGKLPGQTAKASYTLEYGTDQLEAQLDAVQGGTKVIIVDDLLATGGTMAAAHTLLTQLKANILECMVVIELSDLKGRSKIPGKVFSLIQKEG